MYAVVGGAGPEATSTAEQHGPNIRLAKCSVLGEDRVSESLDERTLAERASAAGVTKTR
ncbi:hypothetical protein HYW68_00745 [Candidatus Parcubacteria bacterium]|nr:hypothetical protein [Candidatus Parcubacteria bacterium]